MKKSSPDMRGCACDQFESNEIRNRYAANKMKITLYRSWLCPRCYMAKKYLGEIRKLYPALEIEEVDCLSQPARAFRDGIRMIPAVKIGEAQLSGLYLTKAQLNSFIDRHST